MAAAGFFLAYALPGGTYDIVIRQAYGAAVWWVLAMGFAFGLLPRRRVARPALLLIAALAAYAIWTAASLHWTVSHERTTAEIARVVQYLGVVGLIVSVLDHGTWTAAAMGLGFAALLVCVLALVSRLAPDAFPANALYLPNTTNRLQYPFGYWNAVGAWASMSTAIGLAWSAHDCARWRRAAVLGLVPVAVVVTYLTYSRAAAASSVMAVIAALAFSRNRVTAGFHAAAAGVAAAIAILAVRNAPEIAQGTGTRGAPGVVAAIGLSVLIAAAAAVLSSLMRTDRARIPRRLTLLLAGASVVALAILAAGPGPRLVRNAWRDFRHPTVAQSAIDPASRLTHLGGGRYYFWSAALAAFKARPGTGTGAGTYEFWWDRHAPDSEFIVNAHSIELENMAELGVPGLLLILAVTAAAATVLATVRRRSRRPTSTGISAALLAAFLAYLLQASVDWMWQSTAVTVLALGGAAVAAGRLSRGRPRIRWYGRVGCVVAAVGAICVQLPGLLCTAEIRRSQGAERSGNARLAYSWANAAVSAEPWAASPYEQRGLVLESAGRLAQAATDLQRAISREPTNFVHWLLLARVQTERGDLAQAARAYARASWLRPKALVFRYAPYFSAPPPHR